MKKLLCFVLVLALSVCMIAGCGKGKDKGDTSSVVQSTVGLSKADVVYLDANGDTLYKIVRPEEPQMDEANTASLVFKQFKDRVGAAIKNQSDSSDGTDAYEILIGATNRPESQQSLDYLESKKYGRYNDWIICTIGKKIIINGYNADAIKKAATYFAENFLVPTGVVGGIEYLYAVQGDFKDITVNGVNISQFTIVRPHFNFSYLPQTEAEKIIEYVYQNTGYMIKLVHDEYVAETEYEIVIGDSSRNGVTKLTNYDEYSISVKGKKIYLNGGSPHATGIAVSEFAKLLKSGKITDSNSTSGSYETAITGYDRTTTYYPTWYDTFDTEGVDLTKWRIMNDPEFSREGQQGKWSCMSSDPDVVYQTGGQFYVQGMEDDAKFYGGTIVNDKHMAFQYGYVEKSAIAPHGPGFWSLLWFNGTSDGTNQLGSPEIDLNECFGEGRITQANCHAWPTSLGESLGYEHTSLDGSTYGNDKRVTCPDGKTFADDFHTYGFLWDEDEMGFYLDGEEWFTYTTNTNEWDIDVFVNSWMFMELSFSVGRLNNGLLCENLTKEQWENSSRFIVDWLYLYQFDDGVQGLKIKN